MEIWKLMLKHEIRGIQFEKLLSYGNTKKVPKKKQKVQEYENLWKTRTNTIGQN